MKKPVRFLVVMHIYYKDQIDLMVDCLKNIPNDYDLYVTLTKKDKIITDKIKKQKPDAKFVMTENVGYDIWPFIKVINDIDLSKYEYVIKLHTKRDITEKDVGKDHIMMLGNGFLLGDGGCWRDNLLAFINNKDNFKKCLIALKQPENGMCTRYILIHNQPDHCGVISEAKLRFPKYIFELQDYCFVAGTMFVSKIKPIQMIKDMNISADMFEGATDDHKTQFAHIIERTIGEAVYKSGMKIVDPFTPSEHIRAVKRKYTTLKIVRRFIQYCFCWVPLPKIRRKLKADINNYFYRHYMKKILILDNTLLTKGK